MRKISFILLFFVFCIFALYSCLDDDTSLSPNYINSESDNIVTLYSSSVNPHDSAGILHNYYAEHIMDNTEIYKHDSLPYALDSLENFVFQEFGHVIDLSGFTDQNSELVSVSHHDNDDFTTAENTFLDNVVDSIEAFDWSQTSPISEWNDMFEDIASDALDNNFDNEEDVLSTVSVAKHSGNLWHGTETAVASSNGVGPNWYCVLVAVIADSGYLAANGFPSSNEGFLEVAVFSLISYIQC